MAGKGNVFLMASVFALALCAATLQFRRRPRSRSGQGLRQMPRAQPADIETGGGKHKTEISCQDCHTGHRPASKNNIPECANCHEGEAHFKLPNCLGCHKNPHTPKNISFDKKQTAPCLTCHKEQIKQLAGFPEQAHATGLFLLPRRPRQEARLHPVPQAARRDDDGCRTARPATRRTCRRTSSTRRRSRTPSAAPATRSRPR